jgi:hypothetical protein
VLAFELDRVDADVHQDINAIVGGDRRSLVERRGVEEPGVPGRFV